MFSPLGFCRWSIALFLHDNQSQAAAEQKIVEKQRASQDVGMQSVELLTTASCLDFVVFWTLPKIGLFCSVWVLISWGISDPL